jgi:hypothetical protein
MCYQNMQEQWKCSNVYNFRLIYDVHLVHFLVCNTHWIFKMHSATIKIKLAVFLAIAENIHKSMWLVWSAGRRFCVLWKWYRKKAIAAKSSPPVSVQYQSSWEFCLHSYVVCGLHCIASRMLSPPSYDCLHSFVGRDCSPSKLCVNCTISLNLLIPSLWMLSGILNNPSV